VLIEPTCCGDLANIAYWREAAGYRQAKWHPLWIGHPSLSVLYRAPRLIISNPHDGEHPTASWAVCPDRLEVAVAAAQIELEQFAEEIAYMIAPLSMPISGDVSSPPSFGSIRAPILSSRPWRPPMRGAQDLSRMARWRRPQGLSLTDRAPRYARCDLGASVGYTSPLRPQGSLTAGLASRSMARAMIASAYIRQLRSGLPLCCMHGRSRRKDGTHPANGRMVSAKRFLSHTSDLPNAPEGASELCFFSVPISFLATR
jgi:hypothetical protein